MSTILIISPEAWGGQFVSKHHYALELARRGHRVLFHGPPQAKGSLQVSPVKEVQGDLSVLISPRVAPGLRFLPAPLRRACENRWLLQVEQLVGGQIDVIWNFENSRFFDLRFAGQRLKIYHQVDLNQNFHPTVAAASSDLTIALSSPIAQRLRSFAPRLMRLTHGHAGYSPMSRLSAEAEACFNSARVNAVMVGNLDIAYLDVQLLTELVAEHLDVRFHFIGSYTKGLNLHAAIAAAPNVVFWGRQPSQVIPAYLERADILLLAYLAEQHLEQLANPHKVMEYLASGRCVLATRTLEYEDRSDLIEMATTRADYAQRFAAIAAEPAFWNSPQLVGIRQSFASTNTYSRQVDRIVCALGPRGFLIS